MTGEPVARVHLGRVQVWIPCADCEGTGRPIVEKLFGVQLPEIMRCESCDGAMGRWSSKMPQHPVDALQIYLVAMKRPPIPPDLEQQLRAHCDQAVGPWEKLRAALRCAGALKRLSKSKPSS